MGRRIDIALHECRDSALASREAEFIGVAGRNKVEWDVRIRRRSDIGAHEGAAGHTFQCQEAAGCDGDPFEENGGGSKGGQAANRGLGSGEAAGSWLRQNTNTDGIEIGSGPRCRGGRRLRRCLAELFLGLLLLAPLLGDALLKLFQPLLEQANSVAVSSAWAEKGWQAVRAPKAIATTALLLSRFLTCIFMTFTLTPSPRLWMRGVFGQLCDSSASPKPMIFKTIFNFVGASQPTN